MEHQFRPSARADCRRYDAHDGAGHCLSAGNQNAGRAFSGANFRR